MEELETLQKIVEAVKAARVDIAPSYHEYYPLAMGIARSCGESGRSYFHELCSLSPKYQHDKADRFFTNCLRNKNQLSKDEREPITLGTVTYLAEQAGIKLSFISEKSRPHARINYNKVEDKGNAEEIGDFFTEFDESESFQLPLFPEYEWPSFLQKMIDSAPTLQQRDVLFLSCLSAFSSTLNYSTFVRYGSHLYYPNLFSMIIGTPASGKGVVTWCKQLVMPWHEAGLAEYEKQYKQYMREKIAWDCLGNKKKDHEPPVEPTRCIYIIPGNNTSTGIKENIIHNKGVGFICEVEIDTMGFANSADYGHFGETLRIGYDNESISFNRRINHEYQYIKQCCFAITLAGTAGQIFNLIPSADDGLHSRFNFYVLPDRNEWIDQFDRNEVDNHQRFYQWGKEWYEVLTAIRTVASTFELTFTDEQISHFNDFFAQVYSRAGIVHGGPMKSGVKRLGLNLCRMMQTIALLRVLDPLLSTSAQPMDPACLKNPEQLMAFLLASPYLEASTHVNQENVKDKAFSSFLLHISQEDFEAVLRLAEPLYIHSSYILTLLPKHKHLKPEANKRQLLDNLPLVFTREEAVKVGEKFEMNPNTVDTILRRAVERGILEKKERGVYSYVKHIKGTGARVGGKNENERK